MTSKSGTHIANYQGKLLAIKTKRYSLEVLLQCGKNKKFFELYDSHVQQFPKLFTVGDEIKGKCIYDMIRSDGTTYNRIMSYSLVKTNFLNAWFQKTFNGNSSKQMDSSKSTEPLNITQKDVVQQNISLNKSIDLKSSDIKKSINVDKPKRKHVQRVKEKKIHSTILTGIITNTNNSRVKHEKNEISFCFKSDGEKRVKFIVANISLEKSSFFKKGNRVSIEVLPDKNLKTKFPNDTFHMLNMWNFQC